MLAEQRFKYLQASIIPGNYKPDTLSGFNRTNISDFAVKQETRLQR